VGRCGAHAALTSARSFFPCAATLTMRRARGSLEARRTPQTMSRMSNIINIIILYLEEEGNIFRTACLSSTCRQTACEYDVNRLCPRSDSESDSESVSAVHLFF